MNEPSGLRRRIVTPAPPAPVPDKREPKPVTDAPDKSQLTVSPKGETIVPAPSDQGGTSVVRATGSMAVATLISRITGFIRTVLIGAALGEVVAASFNTANTLPNLITEIVLGSVLTALVVPVLVRAEKEDPDRGAAFIRRLFTLTLTLMTVVTVVAVAAAPLLSAMMVDEDSKGNLVQTTSFAYLLLPQIFFYGMFSLFMAILNTKEHFRPGAWAPVANNLVSIAVLVAYMALPGQLNPAAPSSISNPHVLLLGLGTTLGVVVQCLIMLPALRKLGIDLRPLWGIDDRLKQFGGMALAIIAYVAISQLGYVITTRIAFNADEAAAFIYQQHWMLLQMPYGIIGVTLLTAIMPRLSRNAANGDDETVVHDLTMGTKLTFIALIPIIIFMMALGPEIGQALFAYGNFSEAAAHTLGLTVSASAFTLIPYALVMLHLRVFYAREEAWTPTLLIAGITLTKIVLSALAPSIAQEPQHVVILLGAANGFGFVAGALIGAFLLRRKLGTLNFRTVMHTSLWAVVAALVGVAAIYLLRWALPPMHPLLLVMLLGVVFLVVTGLVLSRSKLPEVQNLGSALQRIPGMSRIIQPDEERAFEVGETDPRDVSTQFLATDTFNASPVPPPMSAGVVRGPRLVPGASVSDGRFRLIRDHGATTGARFWQAREVATGRDVALTFVDTTGAAPMAPATPREAALQAAGVARRTRKLASLGLPAVADNIEILSYRSGALVVADWIPGSPLRAVAESGQTLHTEAVANSLAPIAGAVAAAQEAGVPLGVDNRQRLRIDADGIVRLAFPAVLPDASAEGDMAAFAGALELLTADVSSNDLEELTKKTRSLVDADQISSEDFRSIETQLREVADKPEAIALPEPEAPEEPEELPGGFGTRRYRPATVGLLATLAVGAVVLIGVLTTYLVDFVSGEDPAPAPTEQVTTTAPPRLPVILGPLEARPWAGSVPEASRVGAAVDGDKTTAWKPERGAGVVIEAGTLFSLQQVLIDATGDTGPYELYGIPANHEGPLELAQLPKLQEGTLRSGQTSADIESNRALSGVLLYLPEFDAGNSVEIFEVALIGHTRTG